MKSELIVTSSNIYKAHHRHTRSGFFYITPYLPQKSGMISDQNAMYSEMNIVHFFLFNLAFNILISQANQPQDRIGLECVFLFHLWPCGFSY